MDFDQEYLKSKVMKSGDDPLEMRVDSDGVARYYIPEEEPMLPEVVVEEPREAPVAPTVPVAPAPKPKAKPVAPAMPTQGQLDLGEAKPIKPTGAMGVLKSVGEMIQSGAEKIDFDVLGLPGIGTLTLKDLTVGDLGKVLIDISQGFPPVTGSGETLKPTTEAIELINVAPAAAGTVKLGKKVAPKIAESFGPTINKMAEDYMRKTGLTMAVAPDSVTKQVTDLMPRVDSIERFPLGPTSIKPKVIAPDVPLHREMDAENLTDFLRNDRQFAYSPAFVTDNPDLAIGQGSNKGVKVKFRPNSISGEENVKPMTGAIAGREYRADVIAPRAIESITFASAVELKKVRPIAANVLKKDFERVTNGGKEITFVRKTQPTEIPVAPKTSTPEFKSWFGQSKVVDDKNKPMVVYHTGAFDADVIKSASQLATDADKASFKNKNNGIYFSKSATYSGMYGEGKQGATTYPVYLSIKNPLIIKSKADVTALGGIFNDTADSMFITPEKLKELKSKGYDGIINDLHNEVVAFEPTQIKSVFNKGTFNPKDPRILYGGGMAGTGAAVKDKERK